MCSLEHWNGIEYSWSFPPTRSSEVFRILSIVFSIKRRHNWRFFIRITHFFLENVFDFHANAKAFFRKQACGYATLPLTWVEYFPRILYSSLSLCPFKTLTREYILIILYYCSDHKLIHTFFFFNRNIQVVCDYLAAPQAPNSKLAS